MRLQTLEIKGFKSFADETVIHFNEDVIGIVGPNGSGKSNVVDAIRWVLGEQKSSELRLDTMTSLIFNGLPGNTLRFLPLRLRYAGRHKLTSVSATRW